MQPKRLICGIRNQALLQLSFRSCLPCLPDGEAAGGESVAFNKSCAIISIRKDFTPVSIIYFLVYFCQMKYLLTVITIFVLVFLALGLLFLLLMWRSDY